jgi:nucleotide-binding universal stress UspA family protein
LFSKILVPLDGSEHSLRALDVAIQIAKKFSGKITLIHVYSVTPGPVIMPEPGTMSPSGFPVMAPVEISSVVDAVRKAGDRILEDGERKAKAEGIEVEKKLLEGHTVQEIVRMTREERFELIVVGARGISHIRELLLGSVTDGVIHHASAPVLVVKPQSQS